MSNDPRPQKFTSQAEVDEAIERWHQEDQQVGLLEALGWSYEQYHAYVTFGTLPPGIDAYPGAA